MDLNYNGIKKNQETRQRNHNGESAIDWKDHNSLESRRANAFANSFISMTSREWPLFPSPSFSEVDIKIQLVIKKTKIDDESKNLVRNYYIIYNKNLTKI